MKVAVEHVQAKYAFTERRACRLLRLAMEVDTSFAGLRVTRVLDAIIANWRRDYNECRPHSSLKYLTPVEFAAKNSGGKDADFVRLENEPTVFHFHSAAATAG